MSGSLRPAARLAGLLWTLTIVFGVLALFGIQARMVVSGDAPATARNILAAPELWRIGFVAELLATACYVGAVVLLAELLKPSGRLMSRLALAFAVIGGAVAALNGGNTLAALLVLQDPTISAALGADAPAMMRLFLRMHAVGYDLALVFFSALLLPLLGWLGIRSGWFPRALGLLLILAGACYFVFTFTRFLAPSIASLLWPWIIIPCFVAEASVALWLLLRGPLPDRMNSLQPAGEQSPRHGESRGDVGQPAPVRS